MLRRLYSQFRVAERGGRRRLRKQRRVDGAERNGTNKSNRISRKGRAGRTTVKVTVVIKRTVQLAPSISAVRVLPYNVEMSEGSAQEDGDAHHFAVASGPTSRADRIYDWRESFIYIYGMSEICCTTYRFH